MSFTATEIGVEVSWVKMEAARSFETLASTAILHDVTTQKTST
jgi:hypothetical protein